MKIWIFVPGICCGWEVLQTEKIIGHFQSIGKDGTGFRFAEQESYDFLE